MYPTPGNNRTLVFALLESAATLERRLDGALSSIKGITFSEYRLLDALKGSHDSTATRVDLARAVGVTPSGVTRALKPLDKLGFVTTLRDERDARRSLATLTVNGVELLADATGVVEDTITSLSSVTDLDSEQRDLLLALLAGLGR